MTYRPWHKIHTFTCSCGKSFSAPKRDLAQLAMQATQHQREPHGDKGSIFSKSTRIVDGLPE